MAGLPMFQRDAINSAMGMQCWPWYFYGPAGRGKTFIAAAIYRHWPGSTCCFWNASKILMDFVMDRHTSQLILNSVRDASLLVIDDLGVRVPTDSQLDALLVILNTRQGKPLVLTGNLGPADLKTKLDDRCGSRICGGHLFEVLGEDHRLKQAKLFEI